PPGLKIALCERFINENPCFPCRPPQSRPLLGVGGQATFRTRCGSWEAHEEQAEHHERSCSDVLHVRVCLDSSEIGISAKPVNKYFCCLTTRRHQAVLCSFANDTYV